MGDIRKCKKKEMIKKTKLIQWFIGFCDAEGNFQTTLTSDLYVKYSFHLSLHIKELPLIEYLIKELNFTRYFIYL